MTDLSRYSTTNPLLVDYYSTLIIYFILYHCRTIDPLYDSLPSSPEYYDVPVVDKISESISKPECEATSDETKM